VTEQEASRLDLHPGQRLAIDATVGPRAELREPLDQLDQARFANVVGDGVRHGRFRRCSHRGTAAVRRCTIPHSRSSPSTLTTSADCTTSASSSMLDMLDMLNETANASQPIGHARAAWI